MDDDLQTGKGRADQTFALVMGTERFDAIANSIGLQRTPIVSSS